MARTTAADVADIYDTEVDTASLEAHIEAASALVDDVAETDSSVTEDRLALIETYVAAHFVSLQDPRVTDETIASASWTYDTQTSYMDMAIQLDPTGVLDPEVSTGAGFHVLDSRGTDDPY